jgi:eukaryotic-like serine/threonine-protein kinase
VSLAPGTRLGPYEISAQIGAGGMGEVYRATDVNLKRQVALKVLPEAVAADGDRLARFQREAEVLASLNHPNIAIIHGLEKGEGITALVMELVEGPTLADRIVAGPMPIDETLGIAKQIAEALEAAHEQGIIHRDLKPANVKVRPDGTVKVLDFGLAKAMGPPEGSAGDRSVRLQPDLSMSPTITTPAMTQVGMIMGTAAYMSPEQARGRAVDKRSDIWAFGCVLFEMLTGMRAFQGDDVSETLASVLAREPDWNRLPSDVPAVVAIYLRRCLQKNPKARIADVQDLRLALTGAFDVAVPTRDPSTPQEPPRPLWRRALPLVTTALVVAVAAASAAWVMRPADPRPVMRSIHTLPEGRTFRGLGTQVVAIAPDGRYFVYSGTGGLFVRSMDALEDRLIPGTENVSVSFDIIVSPDGQSVAFFRQSSSGAVGELVRMPVAGGATVTLTDTDVVMGGTWGEDGAILYAQPGGLWEVSQNGGEPRRVITLKSDELAFRPQRLPGGDWILFTVTRTLGGSRWDMADIVVESVASGERRVLRRGGSDGRYLPTGHLVYAYQDVLYAAVFDRDRLEVTGETVPVVQGVRRVDAPGGNTGAAFFAASTNGTLVYVPGTSSAPAGSTGLAWVERDGRRTALDLPQGRYSHPRLSPDGKWLAVERQSGATVDIWIYETSGATEMRRLTDGGNNRYPVWSRDGASVAFQSDRDGNPGIFLQKFDGTGSAEPLTTTDGKRSHTPEDWSSKDDLLAFTVLDGAQAELWMWSRSDRTARRFGTMQSAGPFDAVFSPDGRWLAYSQRIALAAINNVLTYVHSVASPENRFQVGRDEDQVHHPLWSPDGRQLIYFPGGGAAVAVDVRTEPSFGVGRPTALPGDGLPINVSPGSLLNHDVHPDGRFVTVADVEPANGARNRNAVVIVHNWFEELKRLVPQ